MSDKRPDRLAIALAQLNAVVGDIDDHFGAFTVQANRDLSAGGLAVALPDVGLFDAVNDGIAQHMLEGR